MDPDQPARAEAVELIRVGRVMYYRGPMAGNGGNISVRLDDDPVLITSTGVCKGRLAPGLHRSQPGRDGIQVVLCALDGRPCRRNLAQREEDPGEQVGRKRRPRDGERGRERRVGLRIPVTSAAGLSPTPCSAR